MDRKNDLDKINLFFNNLSEEEIQLRNESSIKQNEADFKELKESLLIGICSYCGKPIFHFTEKTPCFHWLLKPKGVKKKHFHLLFEKYSFHQLNPYLRWVANCEHYYKNINDLKDHKSSSKYIEETIKYKKLEWSFSCSHSDRLGHSDRHQGKIPHYHFQMKVDGLVVIGYNDFHIPFKEYDELCFLVRDNKVDRVKVGMLKGAGMQTLLDHVTPENIDQICYSSNSEDSSHLNLQTLIVAPEGQSIKSNEIKVLFSESKRTGVSMNKLAKDKFKDFIIETIISEGEGVPDIAKRSPLNRGNKKSESSID